MRNRKVGLLMCVLAIGALLSAAFAADGQYVGAWSGTWEGAGASGRFDLTLGAGGKDGSVSVGTDGGDYNAKFSAVSISGNKLNAKYTYPLDEQGEITLTATFEGNKATGIWSLGAKGAEGQPAMATGTWTVTKK